MLIYEIQWATYYAVELAAFIALGPPEVVLTLADAELPEVLSRLGRHVSEELKVDTSKGFSWKPMISIGIT